MRTPRRAGAVVAVALLSTTGTGWCEDPGPRGITGTVSFDNAHHAFITSGAVFGAVKVIDRTLRFTGESPAVQVNYEANWIFNAAQVPSVCPVDDLSCPKDGYALQSVDVLAGGLGLASCSGGEASGCVFFATGFTSAVGAPSVASRFGLATVMTPAAPFLGMLYTAGVMKSGDPEPGEAPKKYVGGLTPSYIVGGAVEFPTVGQVRLGYLSTSDGKGTYTDLTGMRVKAFLTAAFADTFSRLPFFSSGLRDQLVPGEDVYEMVGATSAYVRKVDMSPPNLPEAESLAGAVDFWTAHLQQKSIAQVFDISGAMAFQPSTLFHAVTAGIHTPNVDVPRDEHGKPAWGDSDGGVGFGLHAGLVNLPKLAYYGAQGGRSFYVSADIESESISSTSETRFKLSLRRNDPETLALFPYAQNALGLYMQMSGGWK